MVKYSTKVLIVLISVISCTTGKKNSDQLLSTIDGLLGNEVTVVQPSLIYNESNYNPFNGTDYKIVVYTDSTDCVGCLFKLDSWDDVIKDFDNNFKNRVSFLFYFHPLAQESIENRLIQENFKHPIFIDVDNKFYNGNQIPQSALLRCFLLDRNNQIISVGNPTLATGSWALFREMVRDNVMYETLHKNKSKHE